MSEVRLESDDFNRLYTLKCADASFATALVDELMMQWLLGMDPTIWRFEVAGPWVLCACGPLVGSLARMHWFLNGVSDFVHHIPHVVASLYPPTKAPI